jgi:hypothetical protein
MLCDGLTNTIAQSAFFGANAGTATIRYVSSLSKTGPPVKMLCGTGQFRPDCRWIAGHTGVPVDEVNIALQRLLRLGLLELTPDGSWRDCSGLGKATAREFRRVALARVRAKAAEDRVIIGRDKTERG